ncbi:hypothetical protein ACFE04_011887 [Oxalis oulophora]
MGNDTWVNDDEVTSLLRQEEDTSPGGGGGGGSGTLGYGIWQIKQPMEKQAANGCKPLTTFVRTDTNTFREVVQRLTGLAENNATKKDAPITKVTGVKRQTSKLHERRQYRPKLEIVKPSYSHTLQSPSNSRSFNSSPLGTPSTILSQLSIKEIKEEVSVEDELNNQEEEKAIKERRFYLRKSPRHRPGYTEPELLCLFPLTSPRTGEKI